VGKESVKSDEREEFNTWRRSKPATVAKTDIDRTKISDKCKALEI
jgi:hypothetical protein